MWLRLTDLVWSGLVWFDREEVPVVVNSITEAKARLSSLVERASQGEEIIISKAGKPVAVLLAYSKAQRTRMPGRLKGQISIHHDFDELPEDIGRAFGMKSE